MTVILPRSQSEYAYTVHLRVKVYARRVRGYRSLNSSSAPLSSGMQRNRELMGMTQLIFCRYVGYVQETQLKVLLSY